MPETYLTAADRDLIRVAAALYGWASEDEAQEALEKGVERIVRRHRAEALADVLDLSEEIITIHGYRHDVIQTSAVRRLADQIDMLREAGLLKEERDG